MMSSTVHSREFLSVDSGYAFTLSGAQTIGSSVLSYFTRSELAATGTVGEGVFLV